ncbi:unnamed protein product [Ectocarpus fasciculatus]
MAARKRGGGGAAAASRFFTGLVAWTTVLADDLPIDEFTPRSYDGIGNNEANPTWGAVGAIKLRSVAQAEYDDEVFTPPGDLTRPTAREVMTDVFLASPPAVSTESALFVAWGQLLTYDLSLTVDNSSEPFDIACNDGNGAEGIDIWCPLGASSDPISFFRSDAGLSDDDGANSVETRSRDGVHRPGLRVRPERGRRGGPEVFRRERFHGRHREGLAVPQRRRDLADRRPTNGPLPGDLRPARRAAAGAQPLLR